MKCNQALVRCPGPDYSEVVVVAVARRQISGRAVQRPKLLAGRGPGCRRWQRRSLSCLRSAVASAICLLVHDSPREDIAT